MHNMLNGGEVSFSMKLTRKFWKDYHTGGLTRTDPERYLQTFKQTEAGKYAMRQIKKMTHDESHTLITTEDSDECDNIIFNIMASEPEMTGDVYRDYMTTKTVKLQAIPENVYGFPGGGCEIRDFIYTQLHEWLTEHVSVFVERRVLGL
jgi:hypothetical protein